MISPERMARFTWSEDDVQISYPIEVQEPAMKLRSNQKLDADQAAQVRALAQAQQLKQRVIAQMFSISTPHVCNIKKERRWRSLSEDRDGTAR